MAKHIKVTEAEYQDIREAFEKALASAKVDSGQFNFTHSLCSADAKATVYISELAMLKMVMLVYGSDKEVGWHGVAERYGDPEKNEYLISDVLIYPQKVTGATVTTDQEEYQKWLVLSLDDHTFQNLRMHGHSHVSMGTTPSQTDLTMYKELLENMHDDTFYIFMIWNKTGSKTVKIYDMAKNLMFDSNDITLTVLDGGIGVYHMIQEAKDNNMVRENTYTPPKTTVQSAPATQQSTYTGTHPAWRGYGYGYDDEYGDEYGYGSYYGHGGGYGSLYKEVSHAVGGSRMVTLEEDKDDIPDNQDQSEPAVKKVYHRKY